MLKTFQDIYDAFWVEPVEPEPDPPVEPDTVGDFVLRLGVAETGQWGNRWAGRSEPDGEVVASFAGTEQDLTLSVTGYDIDIGDEVEVLLNGDHLGYLSAGPNDALNGGDRFFIAADAQREGENVLTFKQTQSASWIWGVTDLLLEDVGIESVLPQEHQDDNDGHDHAPDERHLLSLDDVIDLDSGLPLGEGGPGGGSGGDGCCGCSACAGAEASLDNEILITA